MATDLLASLLLLIGIEPPFLGRCYGIDLSGPYRRERNRWQRGRRRRRKAARIRRRDARRRNRCR